MENKKTLYLNVEQTVDYIIEQYGKDIRIAMPLGLGKSATLFNALYKKVKNDPSIKMRLITALTLEKPGGKSDIERRFFEPVVEKHFNGVKDQDYMHDIRSGNLPDNVKIMEIYCKAGSYTNNPEMQQNYISSNYSHNARDANALGNAIFTQMLAVKKNGDGVMYSGACNADLLRETFELYKENAKKGIKNITIGVVNPNLPFMYGDAVTSGEEWDVIVDDPECYETLFGTPRAAVSVADFMTGLHVSTLIKDGGTLQIGIGALGDAIAHNLSLRNNNNEAYNKLLDDSGIRSEYKELIDEIGGSDPFEKGLYGSTEMLVDGFVQLYKNGVMKRKVYHHIGVQKLINDGKMTEAIPNDILQMMMDDETLHPYLTEKDFAALKHVGVFKEEATYADGQISCAGKTYSPLLADADNLKAISDNCLGSTLKNGVILTGSFFIGPTDFYEDLKNMPVEEQLKFEMTGVNVANQLYGDEELRRLQRKDGRFCNTGMKATVLGHVSSDTLENGTVVSGVGGQYNFVSMAHALHDGRLIIMIKSTRQEKGKAYSNIVYNYGNVTIPRHLRDIVVTEYGIADIRSKTDADVIKAMLNITDSRFQDELLAEAKKNGKIPADYEIPEKYRNNTPKRLAQTLAEAKSQGLYPDFPFGTIFTGEELMIAYAMKAMKAKMESATAHEIPELVKTLPTAIPEGVLPLFERMGLTSPSTPEEKQSYGTFMLMLKVAGFF